MAIQDVTQKAEIYHTLYQINSSFAAIVGHFDRLRQAGVSTAKSTREFQGFTQELQAEFNQEFLEGLHQLELDDWNRYGKIRQAQEKRLRDPDDVFIHAAERRKQLAKQKQRKKL
jgi:Sec-independent protein translocase protein TatA